MVLVMLFLRKGKSKQDPSPDRSTRGRSGGRAASLALATDSVPFPASGRRGPWKDHRVQERCVCCFRLVESGVAQKPNPRVGREFRSIKTIYFAANDFRPL